MCCVTFASDTAQFGEPEIRFSTAPPAVIMPWIIGLKKAREILYTGDFISAEEARECGMVNRVFADDKLEEETYRYARRAASISQEGLRTTKASINRGAEIAGLRQAMDVGIDQGAMLDSTPTEVYVTFKRITKEEGLAAAIAGEKHNSRCNGYRTRPTPVLRPRGFLSLTLATGHSWKWVGTFIKYPSQESGLEKTHSLVNSKVLDVLIH